MPCPIRETMTVDTPPRPWSIPMTETTDPQAAIEPDSPPALPEAAAELRRMADEAQPWHAIPETEEEKLAKAR